jgi:hypothetical protein
MKYEPTVEALNKIADEIGGVGVDTSGLDDVAEQLGNVAEAIGNLHQLGTATFDGSSQIKEGLESVARAMDGVSRWIGEGACLLANALADVAKAIASKSP